VRRVEQVESRIEMAGKSSPGTDTEGAGGGGVVGGELALAAALGYHKVLSYKDEYEVDSTCACHLFYPFICSGLDSLGISTLWQRGDCSTNPRGLIPGPLLLRWRGSCAMALSSGSCQRHSCQVKSRIRIVCELHEKYQIKNDTIIKCHVSLSASFTRNTHHGVWYHFVEHEVRRQFL
jgi:hypothetical protein